MLRDQRWMLIIRTIIVVEVGVVPCAAVILRWNSRPCKDRVRAWGQCNGERYVSSASKAYG